MTKPFVLFSFIALAITASAAAAEPSLAILPGDFTLFGPAARQTVLVEESRDGQYVSQETEDVKLSSSNEKIVRIDGNEALPVANGEATVTAQVGKRSAKVKVRVVE